MMEGANSMGCQAAFTCLLFFTTGQTAELVAGEGEAVPADRHHLPSLPFPSTEKANDMKSNGRGNS